MTFSRFLLSILTMALLASAPAFAATETAEPVGHVVSMTPAVFGRGGRLDLGSAIYADDVIRTGPSGVVELMFIDNTRLVLGSRSSVVIDKFVYDKDGKARAVVLKLTTGAFRFATGGSPKKAYKVNTPSAAIGVRGTNFDVELRQAMSRVTIFEGAMRICPPHRPLKYCKIISKPGETALVQNGVVTLVKDGVRLTEHCTGTSASKICYLFGPFPSKK